MAGRLHGKLSYANVMATIAVFIALGGASYAAIHLKKNSVGTKQLKNGAVTKKKLAARSVNGSKVAPHSLSATNFAPGSVGTITGVSPGSGLSGGGTSGSVSLNADESVLQHRLDGGCPSGQAIQSVDQAGASTCKPFFGGSGQAILLDNALTTGDSPITIANLGFMTFEVQCSDNGANGTIELVAKVPDGGDTHVSYRDNGGGTPIVTTVLPANSSTILRQVTDGFGKVEFSIGNAGFPGAGAGNAYGTVYLNASYQNSTGTCNDLGYVLGS